MKLSQTTIVNAVLVSFAALFLPAQTFAQSPRCDIPREARDIWHCDHGFVIGPENVIIRLPIPETDPEALYNAGVEAAQREDWRVAIAYFTAAHQRAHLVPRYMYNLGVAHARAGHEVAAISWLSTYLLAAPDAPNRNVIWAQIEQLESAARRKIDLLFDRAEVAASTVPSVASSAYDERGARSHAYAFLAVTAAQANDQERVQRLTAAANSASLRQPPRDDLAQEFLVTARNAAAEDNDLALAESLSREIQSTQGSANDALEQLRRGGFNLNLCRSYLLDPYPQRFVCARGWGWGDPDRVTAYDLLRAGNRDGLLAQLQRASWWREDPVAVALSGQTQDAYVLASRASEEQAAFAAEVLLRTGRVRDAARFAQLAQRRVETRRYANGVTREMSLSGWAAARINALVLVEQGQTQQALDFLEIFLSRRLTNWSLVNETYTPSSIWSLAHNDGVVLVIEYLIDRGRVAEAIELTTRLDSLRRALILNQIASAISRGEIRDEGGIAAQAAAQSFAYAGEIDDSRRRAVEEAIMISTTLEGACYDIDWWLAQKSQGAWRAAEAPYSPELLVSDFGLAAAQMARGVRRAHAVYARAGGTWGQ